jgi:hypothetical protein
MAGGGHQAGVLVDVELVGQQQGGAILDLRVTPRFAQAGAQVEVGIIRMDHRRERSHLSGGPASDEQKKQESGGSAEHGAGIRTAPRTRKPRAGCVRFDATDHETGTNRRPGWPITADCAPG